jgi:hypothetical protein
MANDDSTAKDNLETTLGEQDVDPSDIRTQDKEQLEGDMKE